MDHGWIKIHRSIITWEWYDDINTKVLFLHLLIRANHKLKFWRKIPIDRGSFLTSVMKLSEETGLSIQKVRNSLNKLKSTNEITIKTTNKYSMVSICNYDTYQPKNGLKQHTKEPTIQQADNKQTTTTKKERLKEKKNYSDNIKNVVDKFYLEKIKHHKQAIVATAKVLNASYDTIDKLNRIDKIPLDVIQVVIMRSIKDEFWQNQIISLAGLRTVSKNKQTKFVNASASLLHDYRPAAPQRQLLGFRYKCPACENITVEREYKNPEEFDAYTCKVEDCAKVQLVNKEMVGSTLQFVEKVYKEES